MGTIGRAAVIGAGTMGSQIAAQMANAGVPVVLLDILPDADARGPSRSKLAADALLRLRNMRPAALTHAAALDLITPGNLEDHLGRLETVDWVLEAVVERLPVKLALWERIAPHIRPGTIISSNTSGISCAAQAAALPEVHRAQFIGAHFFNPPRQMRLLELIPTPQTLPAVVSRLSVFGESVLGKGVVVAEDVPGFIANRIGGYALKESLRSAHQFGLTVELVDAITGELLGRPPSGTFRTLDLVGLDVFVDASRNTASLTGDPAHQSPAFVEEMVKQGLLGNKVGAGFYRRSKSQGDEDEVFTMNLNTLAYGPRRTVSSETLQQALAIEDLGARMRFLVAADDDVGRFVWKILSRLLAYCATWLHEIAKGDAARVDRALRWGWGWRIGPFEVWNALGVPGTAARMRADGLRLPEWVATIDRFDLEEGAGDRLTFDILKRDPSRIVSHHPGAATLVDLGDDVLGLELHFPRQAITGGFAPVVRAAVDEVLRNWRGLVISTDSPNFSGAAELRPLLQSAHARDWAAIARQCSLFQEAVRMLKYLPRPVVAALRGLTVGRGMEIAVQCRLAVAAAETRMGLVELDAGLLPVGGGLGEMSLRAAGMLPTGGSQFARPKLIQFVGRAFETITAARLLDSAAQAREAGYLRPSDIVVMNCDRILTHAKQVVLELERRGVRPAAPSGVMVAGMEGRAALELAAAGRTAAGFATEFDRYLAGKVAHVLCGGDVPADTIVSEQYLLELEREAFLELCGDPRTLARMQHMVDTGKPLRN